MTPVSLSRVEPRDDERLWTKRDVADYLGINVRSVERLPIPRVALRITGRRPVVRYHPEQVREWVDARSTKKSTTRKAS